VTLNVLPHLWPKIGGRDFNVGFVSHVVSSEDAIVGLAHCFFSVSHGEVEHCSWVVEVVQSDPNDFVFILKVSRSWPCNKPDLVLELFEAIGWCSGRSGCPAGFCPASGVRKGPPGMGQTQRCWRCFPRPRGVWRGSLPACLIPFSSV